MEPSLAGILICAELSTFGKALGNGFSVSALAGRREFMRLGSLRHLDPAAGLPPLDNARRSDACAGRRHRNDARLPKQPCCQYTQRATATRICRRRRAHSPCRRRSAEACSCHRLSSSMRTPTIGSVMIGLLVLEIIHSGDLRHAHEINQETLRAIALASLIAESISGGGANPGVVFFIALAVVLGLRATSLRDAPNCRQLAFRPCHPEVVPTIRRA